MNEEIEAAAGRDDGYASPSGDVPAVVAAPVTQENPGLVQRVLGMLGPGFITGASDDDPSGIGTYAQVGAATGYTMLWMAPYTFPLMAGVQLICAKIGMVSGMGLAGVLRIHYSRWLLYPAVAALVVANTLNAGVDIGAIAAAINMWVPIPITAMIVPIALVILAVQIFGSFRFIERTFKWLTLALLAYIGASIFAKPDWGAVLQGTFIPTLHLDPKYLATLVAVLGTTISPYLFFWQANMEVEEEMAAGHTQLWQRQLTTNAELQHAKFDVNIGMFFSNLVMFFIILATAATLHKAGKTDIQTATDAAMALRPLAGNFASALLGVGLIGAGLLAVPILTGSASYAVCEAFQLPASLDSKPFQAKVFYAVMVASTLIGMLVNFVGINPMAALFWTAVINGFLAPPLLLMIMFVANNQKVMGRHKNGWVLNMLGWSTTVLMTLAAGALILTWGQS